MDVAETPQASPFLEAHKKQFHQPGLSSVSPHPLLVRAVTGQTLVMPLLMMSCTEMLDCGSTPGNGSFLSFSSGLGWPAPWRFFFGARRLCAQSLPHQWVLADEIALFSLRSSSSFGTLGRWS